MKVLLFDTVLLQKQAHALLDDFQDVAVGDVENRITGMVKETVSGNLLRQVLSGVKTGFTKGNCRIVDGGMVSDYADIVSDRINRHNLEYRIVWLAGHGLSMDDVRARILDIDSCLGRTRAFLDDVEVTGQKQDRLLEMVEKGVYAEHDAVDGFDARFKRILGYAAMNKLYKRGPEYQLAWLFQNRYSEDDLNTCLFDSTLSVQSRSGSLTNDETPGM